MSSSLRLRYGASASTQATNESSESLHAPSALAHVHSLPNRLKQQAVTAAQWLGRFLLCCYEWSVRSVSLEELLTRSVVLADTVVPYVGVVAVWTLMRIVWEGGIPSASYWLTRIVYLRSLAFIYAVAFLVALRQNKQLIGDRGLLPARFHLDKLIRIYGGDTWRAFMDHPTLFLFVRDKTHINRWLDGTAFVGLCLSCVVLWYGGANLCVLFAMLASASGFSQCICGRLPLAWSE